MGMSPDPPLVALLTRHGQEHLLKWWDQLGREEQVQLLSEIEGIDFELLATLIATLVRAEAVDAPAPERVRPIDVFRLPRTDSERVARRHATEIGAAALAAGEVAV